MRSTHKYYYTIYTQCVYRIYKYTFAALPPEPAMPPYSFHVIFSPCAEISHDSDALCENAGNSILFEKLLWGVMALVCNGTIDECERIVR